MSYEQTRLQIETSSWYREITDRNFTAAKLIEMPRRRFEHELRMIIDRHRRQQVTIDEIKLFCHLKA